MELHAIEYLHQAQGEAAGHHSKAVIGHQLGHVLCWVAEEPRGRAATCGMQGCDAQAVRVPTWRLFCGMELSANSAGRRGGRGKRLLSLHDGAITTHRLCHSTLHDGHDLPCDTSVS